MTRVNNPFITSGYISADYFCDREIESKQLIREIVNEITSLLSRHVEWVRQD